MKANTFTDELTLTSTLQNEKPDPSSPWANDFFDSEDFELFIRIISSDEIEESAETLK